MRWSFGILAAAAAAIALPYACDAPPFASPTYFEPGRQVRYCEGDGSTLPITFSNDGSIAWVEVGNARVQLDFSRLAFDDTYKADGWMLTLDPDASLVGPNGLRRTNCS